MLGKGTIGERVGARLAQDLGLLVVPDGDGGIGVDEVALRDHVKVLLSGGSRENERCGDQADLGELHIGVLKDKEMKYWETR